MIQLLKAALFLLLFWGSSPGAGAQTIWWVMGANGSLLSPGPGSPSLHYTVGEVVATALPAGNLQLTQGFHQVFYLITPVEESTPALWTVEVFPNPTTGHLTIQSARPLLGRLYDELGREIMLLQANEGQTDTDLGNLPAGMYLLQLIDDQNRESQSFKIQVIH